MSCCRSGSGRMFAGETFALSINNGGGWADVSDGGVIGGTYVYKEFTPTDTEWHRYEIWAQNTSTPSVDYYTYVNDARRGTDVINHTVDVWGPQLEQAPFHSSFIPSSFASTTRAATNCAQTFDNIPQLPDAGFVDNFCGQLVLNTDQAPSDNIMEIHNAGTVDHFRVFRNADGDIVVRWRVNNTNHQAVGAEPFPGGLLDVRYRVAGGQLTAWMNAEKVAAPSASGGATGALDEIGIGDINNAGHAFGVYKLFRLVPLALSDEVILGWGGTPTGKPVILDLIHPGLAKADIGTLEDGDGILGLGYDWYVDGEFMGTTPTFDVMEEDIGKTFHIVARYTTGDDEVRMVSSDTYVASGEFLVDFTQLSVAPFTHTRASQATYENADGLIHSVPDDEPAFVGGRYVRNVINTEMSVWPKSGLLTRVDNGDGSYTLTSTGSGAYVYFDLNYIGHKVGSFARFSMEIRFKTVTGDINLYYGSDLLSRDNHSRRGWSVA